MLITFTCKRLQHPFNGLIKKVKTQINPKWFHKCVDLKYHSRRNKASKYLQWNMIKCKQFRMNLTLLSCLLISWERTSCDLFQSWKVVESFMSPTPTQHINKLVNRKLSTSIDSHTLYYLLASYRRAKDVSRWDVSHEFPIQFIHFLFTAVFFCQFYVCQCFRRSQELS